VPWPLRWTLPSSRLLAHGSVALVCIFALGVAFVLDRHAPFPAADVRRGSEGAFARGLEPREIEEGVVRRRWARDAVVAEFSHLPPGPLDVEITVRGHQHPVVVSADGVVLGVIPVGRFRGDFSVPAASRGRLVLLLRAPTFEARGRRLGFMPERIAVRHAPATGLPGMALAAVFLAPALAVFWTGRHAGLPGPAALALAHGSSLLQALALWPQGVVRSPYAVRLAVLLVAGVLLAGWCSRRAARGAPSPWGFAALLLALWVQGVAATHPLLVTSDLVFHSNKLKAAADGSYWPVSLTPHDPPFRFPYGVSFHLLLVPLYRAGVEAEAAIVGAAAVSSLVASGVLLMTLQSLDKLPAALTVAVLQLLPATFGPWSAGNFSNIFAQALTVLFLCWSSGGRRGGVAAGAGLLALSGTAHFGGYIFLLALGGTLLSAREARRDPMLLRALVAGLGLAGIYYAQFLGVVTSQLPRVVEGGGLGRDLLGAAGVQLQRLIHEWGGPALAAAALGVAVVRSRAAVLPGPFRASLLAGAALAFAAVLSPLEVRYLYALTPAVALLAAEGLERLGRWRTGLAAAAILALVQFGLAARGIANAVLVAYRPPP
jgi:hypothetical protein